MNRHYRERGGKLPSKISVSALKTLSEIPSVERLYLSQELARPKWETMETVIGPAERGTAFHQCLQMLSYSREAHHNLESIEALKAQLVSKSIMTEALAQTVPSAWLLDYTQTEMYLRIQQAKRVEKEYPFVIRKQIGEDWTLVQGIIDLYFEEDSEGGGVLVDFKTDDLSRGVSLEAAVLRHREQLKLYAEAIEAIEGHSPKEAWIYFAAEKQWAKVDVSN